MMGTISPQRFRVIRFFRHIVWRLLKIACRTMAGIKIASLTVEMTAGTVVVRLSADLIGTVGGSCSIVQIGLVQNGTVTADVTPAPTITAVHGIRTSHVPRANGAATSHSIAI